VTQGVVCELDVTSAISYFREDKAELNEVHVCVQMQDTLLLS